MLTRADYTRFSSQNAANEGVLQGLLLTQHVYAAPRAGTPPRPDG